MNLDFEVGPPLPCEGVAEGARTLGEVFLRRVAATPERAASYQKIDGVWTKTTWQELSRRARRVARALLDLGLVRGDRIAIVGPTSTEWTVFDVAGHLAGLVTVGVYPNQTAEQVRYLLKHSGSRVYFVADRVELETALAAAEGLESLLALVPWSEALAESAAESQDPRLLPPSRFEGAELSATEAAALQSEIDPQDTAILIYTSGTTGPPKGAMITHANIIHLLRHFRSVIDYRQDDLTINFLPMAHATERVLGFYGRIQAGVTAAFASSIGAVLQEVSEVKPTIFGSVPRIFEKLYSGVRSQVSASSAPKRAIFAWAEGVARKRIRMKLEGRSIPMTLEWSYSAADALVFKKIRAVLGGRVRLCLTGAAPISYEILEFLWAIGIPVIEAYGMTEATVLTHVNSLDAVKLGTVGRPVPGVEVAIAGDGEILMRGPLIFKGYYGQPEASAEALAGGWLNTGDIGSQDEQGYLRITDRKKHLIITAGGKNVAPANIERAIKMRSPLISQVHAHGDRRPYVSALIAPSPLETLAWGVENGVIDAALAEGLKRELLANPAARSPELNATMALVVADRRFQGLFVEPVRLGNRDLARVERVRRFFVLDRDFSVESGEMTPTLKMKRKTIEELFAKEFDRIYEDPAFGFDAEGDA